MRPTFPLAAAIFGLALSAPAFGQADGARFRDTFIQLDANGDTVLERDEIPEAGRAAFDRLLKRGDSNGNGKLEAEEMRGLGQKLAGLNDPALVANRFKVMDKDTDGKVTREEFKGVAANFDKIDTNKDGSLSKEELTEWVTTQFANAKAAAKPKKAAAKVKPKAAAKVKKDAEAEKPKTDESSPTKPGEDETADPARRFKILDKDGDGRISKTEFPRAKLFDRLDTDNDGFLSSTELRKFMKK